MVSLEKVEKLREYGAISYGEAKEALEQAQGDLLEAVILLEQKGKIKPPASSGEFRPEREHLIDHYVPPATDADEESFQVQLKKFLKWCGKLIQKGNVNVLSVTRKRETVMDIPVTLLVVFALFGWWFVIPLIIVSLFFNFRYSFQGPNIGKSKVNRVANTVADAAVDLKKSVKEAINEQE